MKFDKKYRPFSKLSNPDKLETARERRQKAYINTRRWLQKAIRAYEFKAGKQFTDDEIYVLEELENRDVQVHNKIHAYVELIMGIILQNPVKIFPDPVEETDQFLCDVIDDLVSFVDENQTFSEEKYTDASEDFVITGRGYIAQDVRPAPENPEEIEIHEYVVPVANVKIPGRFQSNNLEDAPYIIIENWFSVEDFLVRYPNVKNVDELIGGMELSEMSSTDRTYQHTDYDTDAMNQIVGEFGTDYFNEEQDEILVCQMEYWEHYNRYFGKNPQTGKFEEFDEKNLKSLKTQFPNFEYTKVPDKKVRWFHFTGDKILYDGDSPIPHKGYSLSPCFGYKDKSSNHVMHYGVVEQLIDPQRGINKRWMQADNLMAKQGFGLFAEKDAFIDANEAQETFSDPDAITFLKDGGLAKIKEKSSIDFPAASMQLEQISSDSMREISGISHDLLGQGKSSSEPGIVVRLRQQQGMVILTRMLESVKRMKKECYKRKASIIMKYMPDNQIRKILGRGERYEIREGHIIDKKKGFVAPIRALRDFKYNVKFEDGPGNVTKRMAELSILMEMKKSQFIVDPKSIVEKLEISAGEKANWLEYIAKIEQNQSQMAQAKIQLEQQKIMGGLQNDQAKIQLEDKALETKLLIEGNKVSQKMEEAKLEEEGKERDSTRDMFLKIAQMEAEERKAFFTETDRVRGIAN